MGSCLLDVPLSQLLMFPSARVPTFLQLLPLPLELPRLHRRLLCWAVSRGTIGPQILSVVWSPLQPLLRSWVVLHLNLRPRWSNAQTIARASHISAFNMVRERLRAHPSPVSNALQASVFAETLSLHLLHLPHMAAAMLHALATVLRTVVGQQQRQCTALVSETALVQQ